MQTIIQILVYQSLFLIAYQLIKNEPFFKVNRLYLLLSLAASFVLPFLELNWFQFNFGQETYEKINAIYLPEIQIGLNSTTTPTSETFQQNTSIGYVSILENLYYIGFSIAFGLLYFKIKTVLHSIEENISVAKNDFKIIYLQKSKEAFSFFNFIFIGKEISEDEQTTVLAHELEHVQLKHSYDNSFLALLQVFMWFNPLLYFYRKELQLLHEYQADAKVCKEYSPKKYAWQLLNTAFETKNMSLMSSFYNKSFIKNRITMLQKRKSAKSVIRYAIINSILLLCIGFSSLAQENLPKDEQALLEKYKKEIQVLLDEKDLSVYDKYVINLSKKNSMLTKESFYKMKAFAALSLEDLLNEFEKEDRDFLNKDYATYVKEQNVRLKSRNSVPFRSIVEVEEIEKLDKDVPFASVDRSPVFPGCDESLSEDDLKKCLVEKISQHVGDNFDIKKAKQLGVEGINRVYVRFKINDKGNVTDVMARASHPKLSDEGENIIKSLPQMKPGMEKDKAVNVIYTLPITFTVPEVENNEKK